MVYFEKLHNSSQWSIFKIEQLSISSKDIIFSNKKWNIQSYPPKKLQKYAQNLREKLKGKSSFSGVSENNRDGRDVH